MSQIKFQKLINDFSPTSLVDIFKTHDFFRIKQNLLPAFKDKQFIDFSQLGDFDLEDNTNIVVICARSISPLNERASRKAQYDIGKKILKNFQKSRAGIFVYYDNKGDFRISLIYADYIGVKVNYSTFRRFTYFVSKEQTNTTFFQQVAPLNFTNFQELKEIFSVEKVTKEFFKKYRDLFIELLEDFENNEAFQEIVIRKGITNTADFVKKLMGQIVFLYFVQKKGWLGVRPNETWGTGNQAYLRSLFEDCRKANKNYFNDYLEPLFYKALAEKNKNDYFEPFNCKIPFLNGGLFESVYEWEKTKINIPNKTIEKLLDFFDQYNFTVDENTPSDQEISVDPEMLGKIFENLLEVKDRKDKGAFYTPREIVHYMCRESLVQHLVSETTVPEERIRKLFEIKDTDLSVIVENEQKTRNIKELKEISEKIDLSLRNIKIVDPAVGSGAFPMGMLNEISSIRYFLNTNFLHKKNEVGKELSLYDIKKETLENCIYAVDIEPGAVEIAKLRFWLALIVEYESNDSDIAPPTLPNLDYKIMQGNSLLEEYEGVKLFDEKLLQQPLINAEIFNPVNQTISKLQSELLSFYMKNPQWMQKGEHKDKPNEVVILENKLREFLKQNKKITENSIEQKDLFTNVAGSKRIWDEIKRKHKLFFSESNKEKKKDLRKQIDDLNWLLIESTLKEQKNNSALEKLEKLKESDIKPFFLWHLYFADVFEEKGGFDIVIGNPPYGQILSENEKEIFRGKYSEIRFKVDIYPIFILLSSKLLKKNGFITYIVPNTLLDNYYLDEVRNVLLEKYQLKYLIDLDDKVFESAVVHSMVFGAVFDHESVDTNIKVFVDGTISGKMEFIPASYFKKQDYFCFDLRSYKHKDFILKLNIDSLPFIDIIDLKQTIKTGNDKKYITAEKMTPNHKPILRGKDVFKYYKGWAGLYVNYGKHLANCIRSDIFEQPKILIREAGKDITATYDDENYYIMSSLYNGTLKNSAFDLKYILCLLNSKLFQFLMNLITLDKTKGAFTKARIFHYYKLPIKNIPINKQNSFVEIVSTILDITKNKDYITNKEKQAEVRKLEHQINELVYKLYDITPEEIEIVENSSKK